LRLFLERTDIPPKKRCYFFFPGKIALILSIKPDLEAGIAPEGLGDSEDECGNCVEGGGVDCVASLAGCSGTVGFASPFAVGAESLNRVLPSMILSAETVGIDSASFFTRIETRLLDGSVRLLLMRSIWSA
jgi:hypothetical protein